MVTKSDIEILSIAMDKKIHESPKSRFLRNDFSFYSRLGAGCYGTGS